MDSTTERVEALVDPGETAKPVPGWPDYYVTSRGRIISAKGDELHDKATPDDDRGYPCVTLFAPGRQAVERVHVLVALAFHGEPLGGQIALHRNDEKRDNRASNIYWGTYSDNLRDAYRNGRRGKLTGDDVLTMRIMHFLQGVGITAIARRFSVHYTTAMRAIRAETWGWAD